MPTENRYKEKDITDNTHDEMIPITLLYRDKKSRQISAFKCLYCNNFFSARLDLVKSGRIKSCGCRRKIHCKEMGLGNKKGNTFYFPMSCNFAVCYFDNYNGFFIFDIEDYEQIKRYHWYALNNGKRVDPCTYINGRMVRLSRMLMNTPNNLQVDHINGNTNDLRKCNLRNCTSEENNRNKATVSQGNIKQDTNGKFIITDFPKADTSQLLFETRDNACNALFELQDTHYGNFSYRRSQEIAAQSETNQFPNGKYVFCGGILEEISNLPTKNIFNIILNNIRRNRLNHIIADNCENLLLHQLISDYKAEEQKRNHMTCNRNIQ